MNAALPRFLKSAYRREPLPSFLITIGVVDAVIGGFDNRWSLFTFGLGSVGVAIALRWWLIQRHRPEPSQTIPQHYLPSRSSRPVLPMLTASKKNPRQ
jgi:hypothetical protein